MNIYDYQAAFGGVDKTSQKMRDAVNSWFSLYYRDTEENGEDPCQRVAYTVVNKLVRTVFAEYNAQGENAFAANVLSAVDDLRDAAVQLALVGGESYIKPWVQQGALGFTLIPRNRILVFARDASGEPTDVGTVELSTLSNAYFTLLERRTLGADGKLTLENRLYKSYRSDALGTQVALTEHPDYRELPERYTFAEPMGIGLVGIKTPMLNCVDGSRDGVSVYAAAVGLIHAIDRNEYLLKGEFERGQSRVFTSADLLRDGTLQDNLFVGLDEDAQSVGLTVFSPQLREESFLNRKREYLRNVESVIGLKRGLLSDVNEEKRTATEIASSEGDHALTVQDFQRMWQGALNRLLALCVVLGRLYGIRDAKPSGVRVDWGNGVLHDQAVAWEDYKDMVSRGLIKPEIALGWRFGMQTATEADLHKIRTHLMP